MTLQPETIQLILLLLIAVFGSRAVLPLNRAHITHDARSTKLTLLACSLLIPITTVFRDPPAEGQLPLAVMNIALGSLWLLSILPTPPLAPTLRPAQDLTPDRLGKALLVALFGCTLLVPQAFIPFFILAHLLNQSKFRLVSITELQMPHTISVLLCSAHAVSLLTPISPPVLLIALAATAGAHYVPSGLKKLRMDWDRLNRIGNIAIATREQHNWAPIDRIPFARRLLTRTALLSQPAVILIEVLAVFAFLDQRALLVLFPALIAMHLGIFLTTGICFWKWTIALLGIIVVSLLTAQHPALAFDPINAVVAFCAASILPFAFPTIPTLAWYDAPIARRLTFTLHDGTRSARISPYDLAPLDVILSQARHECYFDRAPGSLDCFGACYEREPAVLLNALSTDPDLSAEEKADRARSILAARGTTAFAKGIMQHECTTFITQLRDNLTRRLAPSIYNHHIWNALERADPDLLRSILAAEQPTLTVERELLFYCAASDRVLTLDTRTVRMTIQPTQCRLLVAEAPALGVAG